MYIYESSGHDQRIRSVVGGGTISTIAQQFKMRAYPRYNTSDLIFCFFQAEDGIRGVAVTGVQTCALPILLAARSALSHSSCAEPAAMEVALFNAMTCQAPRS